MTDTIAEAGQGDLAALRDLAEASFKAALLNTGKFACIAYAEAVSFMRLAAAQGGHTDQLDLIFMLQQFAVRLGSWGETRLEMIFNAQALMVADHLADAGDEVGAEIVLQIGKDMDAEVFAEARRQMNLSQPSALLRLQGLHDAA